VSDCGAVLLAGTRCEVPACEAACTSARQSSRCVLDGGMIGGRNGPSIERFRASLNPRCEIQAAMKRGLQTRDAEMELGAMLSVLGAEIPDPPDRSTVPSGETP